MCLAGCLLHPSDPLLAMLPPHLALLYSTAQQAGSAAAFRTPQLQSGSDKVQSWKTITYEQFQQDVDITAKYWRSVLFRDGVPPKSVVCLW